jgi:hypothetical protein
MSGLEYLGALLLPRSTQSRPTAAQLGFPVAVAVWVEVGPNQDRHLPRAGDKRSCRLAWLVAILVGSGPRDQEICGSDPMERPARDI